MVEPGCPVATTCGGCPLIGKPAVETRALHEGHLRDALRIHLGESKAHLAIQWVTLTQSKGYRRRIRLRILDDASVGFFNAGKSDQCAVLTEPLREVMHRLLETAAVYKKTLSALHHIELREPDADAVASAYFVKRAIERPLDSYAFEQLGAWLHGLHWAIAGETATVPCQRLLLPSASQLVPIGSFLQINQAINALLVSDLLADVKQRELSTFCDLYAGSGNFTLPLLARGLRGHAVELDPEAGRATQLAARTQDLPHEGFSVSDAGSFAELAASSGKSFDLVIVDPPRAGIRQGIASMAAIAKKQLVYCSCNLDTLARDLGHLCRAQFELESITLYDMFPNTSHVESVVWLRAPIRTTR